MNMIPRAKFSEVDAALKREAAVVLIGPRQVGKTTLAHAIGESRDALYLDLENAEHRARLGDTDSFLMMHT
ncbi:AAA family ATPase, partial [Thioalkalivibrio sp. HK1]|uniref:AAA family ATPase n=1 Tax=Thioalkalivibrio sp. HK1 TaxID=1469245 RepID=UPI0012DEDB8D